MGSIEVKSFWTSKYGDVVDLKEFSDEAICDYISLLNDKRNKYADALEVSDFSKKASDLYTDKIRNIIEEIKGFIKELETRANKDNNGL